MPNPITHLTVDEIDAFGAELDAIRRRVLDELGQADADYIHRVVRVQRGLELSGRALLFVGFFPPAWFGAVAALSVSKILDNMEIGHNVMHGQYDWMQDPALESSSFEWDHASASDHWRYSHNYLHHTFTNVIGKDRDFGFGLLRMSEEQQWHPHHLADPAVTLVLAVFFQWCILLYDLEFERILTGDKAWSETAEARAVMARKASRQFVKDYVLFPLMTGPSAPFTLGANLTANLVRNLWTFTIIFCGHFPDGVSTFTVEETENETEGDWYLRQLLGTANVHGRKLFHLLTGNLSHQIEHHLFPDLPARRYADIAVEVRDICDRYELPYNSGGLIRQFGSVLRRVISLSLP